jgi:signal transduction histidine kinase
MGLGLYLCRSIVEAHGGRVWLRSEPGQGTTVFFALPIDGDLTHTFSDSLMEAA